MRNSLFFAAVTALSLNACAEGRKPIPTHEQITEQSSATTSTELSPQMKAELERVKRETIEKAAKIDQQVQAVSKEVEEQIRAELNGKCKDIAYTVDGGTIDQRGLKPIRKLQTQVGQMSIASVSPLKLEGKSEDGTAEFYSKVYRNYELSGETRSGFQVQLMCTNFKIPATMKDELHVHSPLDLSSAFGINITVTVDKK